MISSSALNAQSHDLAVTDVTIAPSTATGNVPVNENLVMIATLTNAGTTIIPENSQFTCWFIVDGDTIQAYPVVTIVGGSVNPGGMLSFASDYFTLANPVPTDFCAAVSWVTFTDPNIANNFSCETNVNVGTAAQVDMSGDSVAIVAPTNIDSFDIDNGTETVPEITEMLAVFRNNGNVIYPAGYPFSYKIIRGNQEFTLNVELANTVNPGETTTRNITNPAVIPASPQEVGTYDLCVVANIGDDNSSNDTACVAFSIIDTYIPPEPVGVADVNTNDYNVTFTNDFIAVSNVNSHLNASIIDMNGRVIANEMIVEDKRISTNTLNAGVYFLQTVNEKTGEVKMNKFSKF